MIQNDVRAFVETTVRDFNGQHENIHILYENMPDDHVDGQPFMAVWSIFGKTMRAEVTKHPTDRLIGFVQIDSLVPVHEGLGDARSRADTFIGLFCQKSFRISSTSVITFREPYISVLPSAGGYARVMGRVGFWCTLPSRK